MIEDLLKDARERMTKSVESTRHEFGSVRTGRASPALLDRISVDYYGAQTPLKLIVYDPRSRRLETVTDLSILDRIKVSANVGYNVFGTASAFWQNRIAALNAHAARRLQ